MNAGSSRASGCSDAEIIEAYVSGETLDQVGERFGMSYITVYRRIRKVAPWVLRPKGNPPGTEPNQRDRRILGYRRAGMTLETIGRLEGVSHQRVHQVLKRWKYAE